MAAVRTYHLSPAEKAQGVTDASGKYSLTTRKRTMVQSPASTK
jgi:hypothetical protein